MASALRAAKRQQLRVRAPHSMAVAPELRAAERLCIFRNVAGSHWYIIVADPGTRRYYILDSLGPRYETVLPTDSRRRMPEVLDLIAAIRGEACSDGWMQVRIFFPQQTNGFDCGLFAISGVALVLAGASLATLGLLPWLQQDQMGTRRREAAEALMSGVVPESWRRVFADVASRKASPKATGHSPMISQGSPDLCVPSGQLSTPAPPCPKPLAAHCILPSLGKLVTLARRDSTLPQLNASGRSKAPPLAEDRQRALCEWARQTWEDGGTISIVTDGSYKERVRLAEGQLVWSSSAGCAWVVGSESLKLSEANTTWQVIGSHGVHPSTSGERPLSNYEAELYGIIGFFREWNALPWGSEPCIGELCLWSDCGTVVDLIMARATRLEVRWRRTAASPAWSEIQQLLTRWPGFSAAWIRGHADATAGSSPLSFVQQGNVLADLHADRGRLWAEDNERLVPNGPLRPNLNAHMTSGAILWTGRTSTGPLTIEGNLAKGWRKLNGLYYMNKFRQDRPLRLARAGDLDIKHWPKQATLDWNNMVFRSKLWNERLPTADVHARNHEGPSAMSDIRTCSLCLQEDLGDAWHAIGLCTHPTLVALRSCVASRLREAALTAAKSAPDTAGSWRQISTEFARVDAHGRWVRPFSHGAPNHWYGEFPHAWLHDAASELGVLQRGDSDTDPIRAIKTCRLQLRSLSHDVVRGVAEIWSTVCALWRDAELEGPRALAAARKTERQENQIYFSAEIQFYQQQAAAAMFAGGPALGNTTAWLDLGRAKAERGRSVSNPSRVVRTTTLHECWGRASQARHQQDMQVLLLAEEDRARWTEMKPSEEDVVVGIG